jgi:CreA protein
MLRSVVALLVLLLALPAAAEDEIGSVGYRFKWLGPNDKIVVEAFDDPDIPGITCYISRARSARSTPPAPRRSRARTRSSASAPR